MKNSFNTYLLLTLVFAIISLIISISIWTTLNNYGKIIPTIKNNNEIEQNSYDLNEKEGGNQIKLIILPNNKSFLNKG